MEVAYQGIAFRHYSCMHTQMGKHRPLLELILHNQMETTGSWAQLAQVTLFHPLLYKKLHVFVCLSYYHELESF